MKKLCKITAFLLIAFLLVPVFSGCQKKADGEGHKTTAESTAPLEPNKTEYKELKIRVYTAAGQSLLRQPVENVLVDIWREKTKVIPEFVFLPTDMSQDEFILMQTAANTLPDIVHSWDLMRSAKAVDALKKADKLYTWDADMIREYMPRHCESMKVFGIVPEELIIPNVWNDGVNYYLPKFNPMNTKGYNDTQFAKVNPRFMEQYFFYLRDDILKMIYPEAKTEKELLQEYIAKDGNMTVDELFNDIPIKNIDDLTNYMRKVKELNLKVGEKPVYGGQLLATKDLSSAIWSASTLWFGVWQGGYSYKGDQWTDLYSDPGFKDYMNWFNKLYNEGLIDPEAFIQTGDQMNAKVNNGEYAVVNFMVQPGMANARQLSIDQNRGYGYRMIPGFLKDMVSETQDLRYLPTSLYTAEGVMVTKSVKKENLAQVLNWLDWNYSLEAEELRQWGTDKFYIGKDENRRFKPEYKDVENQKLKGVENIDGKDATYYGINKDDLSNVECMLFGCPSYYYVPKNVYPKEKITDATPIQLDTHIYFTTGCSYPAKAKYYQQSNWTYADVISDKFKKEWDNFFAPESWSRAVSAVVSKPDDFESEWKNYVDAVYTPEFVKLRAETAEKWRKLYNEKVKKDIEAAYGSVD